MEQEELEWMMKIEEFVFFLLMMFCSNTIVKHFGFCFMVVGLLVSLLVFFSGIEDREAY